MPPAASVADAVPCGGAAKIANTGSPAPWSPFRKVWPALAATAHAADSASSTPAPRSDIAGRFASATRGARRDDDVWS